MNTHTIVLIPGDGIGPDIANAVKKIVDASGVSIQWVEALAGLAALEDDGTVLPERTLELIREHKVALKSPCTTPVGKGFSSVNVGLRKALDLYAAVRPVRSLAGVETRYGDIDLVVVRENTEGLYSGIENEVTKGVYTSLKVATDTAADRILRFAFEYAEKRQRRKVTAFHKANILKLTDGMFIRHADRIYAEKTRSIEHDQVIIDAACMKMVQDPTQFDVIVMENLYGDILSDLCAGLVGGLGVVPGANLGEDIGVFEAVHGSAPDIAGKGIANPLALLMSAVMMLNYLADTRGDSACGEAAARIEAAYDAALAAGEKTGDIGGSLSTDGFADAVIARLS